MRSRTGEPPQACQEASCPAAGPRANSWTERDGGGVSGLRAAGRATGSLRALGLALAMLGFGGIAAAQEEAGETPSEAPAVTPDVPAAGRSTGLPVPRFVSLGADRVHLRYGPGREYPISWVLLPERLPVEIIAQFDTRRKVRLHDDEDGRIRGNLHPNRGSLALVGE